MDVGEVEPRERVGVAAVVEQVLVATRIDALVATEIRLQRWHRCGSELHGARNVGIRLHRDLAIPPQEVHGEQHGQGLTVRSIRPPRVEQAATHDSIGVRGHIREPHLERIGEEVRCRDARLVAAGELLAAPSRSRTRAIAAS